MHMTRDGGEGHWTICSICHSRCPYDNKCRCRMWVELHGCRMLEDTMNRKSWTIAAKCPISGLLTELTAPCARRERGRRCVEMTVLLISPTNTHLHTQRNTGVSFMSPALHCDLILANYIQQCNVGEGRKKKQNGTRASSFFTITHTC